MSSGFVTAKEIEQKKKARQEEWEKVRKPEDPETAPEEPYDPRSLFEQLEEHKVKKQEEWDESHKLKNQIRGLDDDESDFLEKVDKLRSVEERRRILEERQALEEYRKSQERLFEEKEEQKKKQLLGCGSGISGKKGVAGTSNNSTNKQSKLLLGAVKKRQTSISEATKTEEPEAKKSKINNKEINRSLSALSALGDYDSDSDSASEDKEIS